MKNKILPFPSSPKTLEVRNQTTESADVYLYDEIGGWGITASAFVTLLKDLKVENINLHINSPGGSVFDGVTIYNLLNSHPAKVHVHVDGLAASIASLIAMAGDSIKMAENAMMMIHNPWTLVAGNAEELRKQADLLDQIRGTLVSTYVARTGIKEEELAQLLDAETWMTAAEAKAKGFATEVTEAKQVAASFDLSQFRNVPKTFNSASEERKTPLLNVLLRKQALLEKP